METHACGWMDEREYILIAVMSVCTSWRHRAAGKAAAGLLRSSTLGAASGSPSDDDKLSAWPMSPLMSKTMRTISSASDDISDADFASCFIHAGVKASRSTTLSINMKLRILTEETA